MGAVLVIVVIVAAGNIKVDMSTLRINLKSREKSIKACICSKIYQNIEVNLLVSI